MKLPPTVRALPQEGPLRLDGLHDIALPAEVSAWPLAGGWWLVLAALALSLAILGRRAWQRRRAFAYRRLALGELARLRESGELQRLPELLKRVALVTRERREVAALSGAAWVRFLEQSAGPGGFPSRAGVTLVDLAYGSSRAPAEPDIEELLESAERWIRAQGPGPVSAHGPSPARTAGARP